MSTSAATRLSVRRVAIAVILCASVLVPGSALPVLRPLVREMLENLGSINAIGEGVALENFEQVEQAAKDLKQRAEHLKKFDLASAGLDPARAPQFNHFLKEQSESADAIARAARNEDGRTVLLATKRLVSDSCVACHANFREPGNRLSPSVLFMTTFLNSWKEMNRGVALNDFRVIEDSARELLAMARLLSWEQIVATGFGLSEVEELDRFHGYVKRLLRRGEQIVRAAGAEDLTSVVESSYQMWTESCVGCHEDFR